MQLENIRQRNKQSQSGTFSPSSKLHREGEQMLSCNSSSFKNKFVVKLMHFDWRLCACRDKPRVSVAKNVS